MSHVLKWPFRHEPDTAPEVTKTASAPDNSVQGVVLRMVEATKDWGREKTAAFSAESKDKPVTRHNIWVHHDAAPMALMLILLDAYGEEMLDWEPETLKLTIDRDLRQPSNSVWTKILAARTVLHSPSPWRQWEVFHWCARGLAGLSPNFHFLEEPEIGHLLVTMDLMKTVDPEREPQEEVDKFIAAAFKQEGILYLPELFRYAQDDLEEARVVCNECGAKFENDNDIRCITCHSEDLSPIPYEYADVRDATQEIFEKRKDVSLTVALEGLPDSAPGNAAYQLLVHWDYLKTIRSQSIQQLKMIGEQS